MSPARVIRWIESAPDLFEARLTTPEGKDVYVGYIALTPGAAVWRGYVGRGFEPVGVGPLEAMRRAVQQRVAEALKQAGKKVGSEQHG